MIVEKIRAVCAAFITKISVAPMVIVFFLVCMTTVDVVIRKLSPYNIRGSLELTEMGMVIIIWISISFFQIGKGHIRVTMFLDKMPKWLNLFWDMFAHVLASLIMAYCIYGGIQRVQSDVNRDLRSTVLLIPQFPFSTIMVIGEILFLVLLVLDTILTVVNFRRKHMTTEEALKAIES